MSVAKVSVVAYVYNSARWVREMLESVLGQTEPDFEFFFLDDGSTDDTAKIVRSYDRDPRLRYEYQPRVGRGRLNESFNRCLEATTGEWIAIANGDDIYEPEKLARQLAYIQAHREIDVCFHDALMIDADGNPGQGSFQPTFSLDILESGRAAPQMLSMNRIPNPTVLFRRSLIRRIGVQEYGYVHDYHFWLKAALAGSRFAFLPERLIRYRIHEDSHSTSSRRAARMDAEVEVMQRAVRSRLSIEEIYPEVLLCSDLRRGRALAHLELALVHALGPARRLDLAATELRRALALRPDFTEAQIDFGVLELVQGRNPSGLQWLERAARSGACGMAERNLARARAGAGTGYELARPSWETEEFYSLRSGPPLPRPADPPEATILASPGPEDDARAAFELMARYFTLFDAVDPVTLLFLCRDASTLSPLAQAHASAACDAGLEPAKTPEVYLQQVSDREIESIMQAHLFTTEVVVDLGGMTSARLAGLAQAKGVGLIHRCNLHELGDLLTRTSCESF